MKHRIKAASLLLIVFAVAAFGLTTMTSVIIKNSQITSSTINSTQIGNTSPSTAYFSATMAANGPAYPNQQINQQGSYLAWNQTASKKEMDFIDQSGTGVGGFNWYAANSANQLTTNPMSLDLSGNLSTTTSVTSPNFYGMFNGNVNGSASTAGALANSPGQCVVGSGQYVTGIQSNGNANCYNYPQLVGVPGYTTLPNGLVMQWGSSQLPSGNGDFLAFPIAFPHQAFMVVASDGGSDIPSSYVYSASAVPVRTGFYGYLRNNQDQYVSGHIVWFALGF